jgi:hypothetical protein
MKVTFGHDSCTTWTCGSQIGHTGLNVISDFPEGTVSGPTTTNPLWNIIPFVVSPVLGLYIAAKTASKSVRTSR